MYDTVLVPIDGSPGSDTVLDHAFEIAKCDDADVVALFVVDTRVLHAASDRDSVREELESNGESALETAVSRGESSGFDVETMVRDGNPEREIRAVAEDVDADLIVMGSHGKSAREKVEGLGSVSESVVSTADRPVLVTRIVDES